MNILVTGAAGFIGFHVSRSLLNRGDTVVGIDNLNPYYDPALKVDRKDLIRGEHPKFTFYYADICNKDSMADIMSRHNIQRICHLAAQAGVRHSIENPYVYEQSNGVGTLVMLEMARQFSVDNFVYASSSSVYGGNTKMPFSETDPVENPLSLYAATKRANELTANVYHNLFGIPVTGLRFFTVYGPWGRPDMALFIFTERILKGLPIEVFNHGAMRRNFTYIDDIVQGIVAAIDTPHDNEIFNLGGLEPVGLLEFIEIIEDCLGMKALKRMCPLQQGDVPETYADISHAAYKLGFRPKTRIEDGIPKFINWYRWYHGV